MRVLAGLLTTTSLKVAAVFGKDHARVLSRIRTLVAALGEGYEAYFGFMFVDTDIGQGAGRRTCRLFRLNEMQSKIGLVVANLLVARKSRSAPLVRTHHARTTSRCGPGAGGWGLLSFKETSLYRKTVANLLVASKLPIRFL